MNRALKVYWCTVMAHSNWTEAKHGHSRQARVLVATTSQAKAVEAINQCGPRINVNEIRNYGGTTTNAHDIAVATAEPGVVFYSALDDYHRDGRRWYRAPITETEK